jgi:hypothetical protein
MMTICMRATGSSATYTRSITASQRMAQCHNMLLYRMHSETHGICLQLLTRCNSCNAGAREHASPGQCKAQSTLLSVPQAGYVCVYMHFGLVPSGDAPVFCFCRGCTCCVSWGLRASNKDICNGIWYTDMGYTLHNFIYDLVKIAFRDGHGSGG